MGAAARLNPRSPASPQSADDRALARLQGLAEAMTRVSFERCLLSYPAEHRATIRALLQPGCWWTVSNRRAARVEREAAIDKWRARARKVVNG